MESTQIHNFPDHIAIIMDGNRRWAENNNKDVSEGHKSGAKALLKIVRVASDLNIKHLTLYSFSIENWKRPVNEVKNLMNLLKAFVVNDLSLIKDLNVRIRVIGNSTGLDQDIFNLIKRAEAATSKNTGLNLIAAFNYSGRNEITRALNKIIVDISGGVLDSTEINEDTISTYLDTANIPDPDLIIRTSGEKRISNFLLWQCAYSEFVFVDTLWPDFNEISFRKAISQYQDRERRFGSDVF
ncbi:MAG: isoprenyl transferase [Alphaproteobacteria bacterium]|jgi:undecaprenyl diphosphate synthase